MESNDRPEQGRVPDGFTPVRAVECRTDDHDKDSYVHGVELRADDITGLVAEAGRPSKHAAPGSSVSCPGYEWRRPWLFLLDAQGRWIIPQLPNDVCEHSLPRQKGYAAPTWKRDDTWLLDRSRLLEIRKLGCQQRQPVNGILVNPDLGNAHRAAIGLDELAGRVVSVCRYRLLSLHPDLSRESHFTSGAKLTASQAAGVRSAILEEPAAECDQTATSYATLPSIGVGDRIEIAVELDGCRRMLETYAGDHDQRAAAASPELIAVLAG